MTLSGKHLALVALGLTAATGFATAGNDAAAPLRCEIVETSSGGMKGIEANASSQERVTGTYRLLVTGRGANISQSGEFEADAGRAAKLGSVMLGGNGGPYDVRLEVKAGGRSHDCAATVR